MALPDCCAAAQARLIEGGYEASKAHVKALREHLDGKHAANGINAGIESVIKYAADTTSKK